MDTVANTLNMLVNAQRVGKERIAVPYSRFKEELMQLLKAKDVVADVRTQSAGAKQKLIVTLKYADGTPRVSEAIRLSKPGRRHYVGHDDIPWSPGGMSLFILSTSQGLMDAHGARKAGLGGELICELRS